MILLYLNFIIFTISDFFFFENCEVIQFFKNVSSVVFTELNFGWFRLMLKVSVPLNTGKEKICNRTLRVTDVLAKLYSES